MVLAGGVGGLLEARARIAAPGDVGADDRPLGLLARGEPRLDDGGVGIVGPIDPEHAGLALLAGDVVGLVDGRDVDRIPARQQRPDGQRLARGDRAGQDVEAGERELFALLTGKLGLGLGIEKAHLDLAAVDTAGGVCFRDRELDRPLRLVAELGVGAGQGGRHANSQRVLRLRHCARCRGKRGARRHDKQHSPR